MFFSLPNRERKWLESPASVYSWILRFSSRSCPRRVFRSTSQDHHHFANTTCCCPHVVLGSHCFSRRPRLASSFPTQRRPNHGGMNPFRPSLAWLPRKFTRTTTCDGSFIRMQNGGHARLSHIARGCVTHPSTGDVESPSVCTLSGRWWRSIASTIERLQKVIPDSHSWRLFVSGANVFALPSFFN